MLQLGLGMLQDQSSDLVGGLKSVEQIGPEFHGLAQTSFCECKPQLIATSAVLLPIVTGLLIGDQLMQRNRLSNSRQIDGTEMTTPEASVQLAGDFARNQ
jgi:hypothetical protein